MKYRFLLALLATAALGYSTAHAQDDDDDDDQEFDYFAYFSRAHSNLTFGFRATQGARVKFGNLGNIPVPVSTDPTVHNYSNGSVSTDGPRPTEFDANGNPVPTTGGRYLTSGSPPDGNGNPILDSSGHLIVQVTGDFLSYQPGYTRVYTINDPSQVVDGNVVMNQYSAVSEGAAFEGKRVISGGVELQAEHVFTNPSKRFKFSLVAGVSLNGINSKKTGTVSSTLHILTDTYSLNGGTLPTTAVYPYITPDVTGLGTYTASDGSSVNAPKELTVPISSTPITSQVTDDEDGAEVSGVWEVKGSYLVVRFGPELSAAVTPNLSFSAGAGLAGAFVGTNYTAIETAEVSDPGVTGGDITTGAITNYVSKFLPGYYANLDASWAVNERTGFYAGLSFESFGDFNQSVDGRSARIDLGGAASLRGGLNIKF